MSTRHELTDEQWAMIESLQHKPGPGRPPADPRKTLNGILYVLKAGCTWADMPRLAAAETMVGRRTWEGIWCALLSRMRKRKSNGLKLSWMADLFPPKKGRRDWKNQGCKGKTMS